MLQLSSSENTELRLATAMESEEAVWLKTSWHGRSTRHKGLEIRVVPDSSSSFLISPWTSPHRIWHRRPLSIRNNAP